MEYIDIKKIKINPDNPRTVTDRNFEKLVESIKTFPQMLELRPIVVNSDFVILGGNMRLRACQKAGLKTVPVVVADQLTPEQQREFLIKDNVAVGDWEWELLANNWDSVDLENWGLDIPGFDNPTPGEVEEDDFEPELPETPITVLGDVYEIGPHRLVCGDSTSSDDVAKLMDGKKADLVFTDPPYNVNYGNIKHSKFKQREIENDNMNGADFAEFCQGFASNIKLFCDGVVYCWAGPGKDGRIMFTVLDQTLHNSTVIIWNKDQFTLGRGKYQNKHELCWFGWNKSGETFTDDRKLTNVWDVERPKSSELHPTMKPLKLIENALNHNPGASTVLDLFGGSGSTMLATHQMGRVAYLCEIDPKYCDVTIKRLLNFDKGLIIKRNGIITNEFD